MNLDLNNRIDLETLRRGDVSTALGNEFKIQREKCGMSLRDVCGETFISVRFLEAIESGDYSILPGGKDFKAYGQGDVYVTSFLRTYARCLNLNSQISIDYDWPPAVEPAARLALSVDAAQSVPSQRERKLEPPKFGEYVLYLLLTKQERIYLIGDLREEYDEVVRRFGTRKAKLWFYKQVLASLRPLAYRSLTKIRSVITILDFIRQFFR